MIRQIVSAGPGDDPDLADDHDGRRRFRGMLSGAARVSDRMYRVHGRACIARLRAKQRTLPASIDALALKVAPPPSPQPKDVDRTATVMTRCVHVPRSRLYLASCYALIFEHPSRSMRPRPAHIGLAPRRSTSVPGQSPQYVYGLNARRVAVPVGSRKKPTSRTCIPAGIGVYNGKIHSVHVKPRYGFPRRPRSSRSGNKVGSRVYSRFSPPASGRASSDHHPADLRTSMRTGLRDGNACRLAAGSALRCRHRPRHKSSICVSAQSTSPAVCRAVAAERSWWRHSRRPRHLSQ